MRIPDGSSLVRWLLPAEMERNAAFQEELLRLSRGGLRLLGVMEIAVALFLFPVSARRAGVDFWSVLTVGAMTVAGAPASGLGKRVRVAAIASGWLACAALIESELWAGSAAGGDERVLYGGLPLLFGAVIAAVQLIPLQTLALGSALGLLYAITGPPAGAWDGSLEVFILFLTGFATAVSGLMYARRKDAFEEHQRMIELRETIAAAQSRAQMAETAMAVGRLAAAVTHEINTPLGALKSAVDTMVALARRQETAKPEEQQRLIQAQNDLRRSIHDSAERLSAVVERLRRLMALDRSEKREVNINDLVSDAGLLVADLAGGRIKTSWKLNPTPPVVCSTDQMTTALGNILRNAAAAIDDEGAVEVSTSASDDQVEISIRDTGRGMQPEEAATIFEPGFKVENGRVLGGNWSLFTTRQIVHEHGGEIWIETRPGEGTTVHVRLPAARAADA